MTPGQQLLEALPDSEEFFRWTVEQVHEVEGIRFDMHAGERLGLIGRRHLTLEFQAVWLSYRGDLPGAGAHRGPLGG